MRKLLLPIAILVLATLAPNTFLHAQLSGAYTIDATGTASATNYQNFASAVSDMASGTRTDGGPINGSGVSAAVTFTVAAGTYSEQVTIPSITGASAANTITFDGVNRTTRTIVRNSTSSGDYTVRLNGADFIRFSNLTISNTGPSVGFGLQLVNQANDNSVDHCNITVSTTSTSSNSAAIIGGTTATNYSLHGNNFSLTNCNVTGGYYGMAFSGPTGTQATGITIDSCNFSEVRYMVLRLNYINLASVTNSELEMRNGITSGYAVYLRSCSRFDIHSNKMSQLGSYGIYMSQANFNTNDSATIYNNFIGGNFQGTGTCYGIYISTGREVKISHNSVLVDNPGSGARGLYLTGSSSVGIEILNNSFAADNQSTAYAYYIVSPNYVQSLDYNNLFSAGSNLAYLSGAQATLASLQAVNLTFNQNSQAAWPNYTSSTDLHTFGSPLANWATNLTGITTDIDNQMRPLAPDVTKDVGADEYVLPPFDLDIVSLVSPTVVLVGNNTVAITLQNNGSNSLNGVPVTLQYSTDGGTTWTVTETFTPTTLAGSGSQENYTFTAPWNVVTPGNYTICVRINPVVIGDPDASDQICGNVCTGIGGSYTINNTLPTAGVNYNSFTDAAAALSSCGINAPVVFDVAAGTYNETFTIFSIPGASAVNTVTFDGGTTAACTLTTSFTTSNQAIAHFDGADYVTLKNLTIDIPSTFGYGVWFQNQADFNTVDSCDILLSMTSTSAFNIGVLFSGTSYSTYANSGNNNTVSNSLIQGGYYGVRCNGAATTNTVKGNSFINNTVREFRSAGIWCYYNGDLTIRGNEISGRLNGGLTSSYGIYSYYIDGHTQVQYNKITDVGSRGIAAGYYNRYAPGSSIISNNMVGGGFFTSGTAYGLYCFGGINMKIYNNSLNLGSSNGYAYYHSGSTAYTDSLYVVNNIFSTSPIYGNGLAMFFSSGIVAALDVMDYNLFYTAGSNLANFNGTTYPDITALQGASFFFNANSVEGLPGFIGDKNLHIVCSTIDNLGTPIPGITDDYDNEARDLVTPDIGADEYTSQVITYDLGPDTTTCDQVIIWADTNNYVGHVWTGGQQTAQIQVDTTGIYTVTVIDSNNCRATDSMMVTVFDNPTLPFNNDTIGQCSSDTLDALNPGSTYNWSTSQNTQIIVPPGSGTYTVDITSPDGCTLTDSITVTLFSDAVAQLGPDTTFCLGQGALLDGGNSTNGTLYQWSSGAFTQIILVTAPGMYTVTVTTPQGCTATDSVLMNALLAPVVELGLNRTECDQFTLDAGTFGVSYQWNTGPSTQTISSTSAGTYIVTVTNGSGCQSVDSVAIALGATPGVNLGPNQVLCANDVVILDAGFPGFNHQWSNGPTTQTLTVGAAGTYLVQVTDPQTGCVGLDSITLNQSFVSVDLGSDFTLCDGDVATLDAGTAPNAFLWNNGSVQQTFSVTSAGVYSVQVTDASGCVDEDSITVTGRPLPNVAFSAPQISPMLQPVSFTDNSATSVTTWLWDFGDGQSSTQQNPTHTYQAIGTFDVCLTVFDGFCDATTCKVVTVDAPIGIEDEVFFGAVDVYPNPNTGSFSIGFDLPKTLDLNIELFSITGQVMFKTQMDGVRLRTEEIDLSGKASAGMYFLRITSDKGNEMIRKIIIE